ncbi:uncharacterized protein N7496_002594 [Penicillium cataractarum]|uniref:Uncharacterized protein n=1 Tax=Penicillium cataractarum TaxID=2100454 RepID=A0A9W9SKD8_9EURO|nr:uncharacterized protein N7496_002594 [Penicillium cataractarum]KAJ5380166.1 hypothetical protein N7496_002594 [Penicillium cataractarum]
MIILQNTIVTGLIVDREITRSDAYDYLQPLGTLSIVKLGECTIVWLCPLEVELRVAIAMLDRLSDDIPMRARGQHVVYTVGKIGPHKIAVVGYYQELLVGIAGGIPSSTNDIQLGDVAIAVPEGDRPGIVGYDLGKARNDGHFELKHWQNSTHPMIRSVINVIRAREDPRFRRHLRVVDKRPEFRRPESTSEMDQELSGSIL